MSGGCGEGGEDLLGERRDVDGQERLWRRDRQPIVTAAMAEVRPAGEVVGSLRDEVGDVIERGGDLFKAVRAATADGRVDPREGAQIEAMLDDFFAELHQARQALGEAMRPAATLQRGAA